MIPYKNLSGRSGIIAYKIGDDYIDVLFSRPEPYRYSYRKAGKHNVETMKKLAVRGSGLNAYINAHVKYLYD